MEDTIPISDVARLIGVVLSAVPPSQNKMLDVMMRDRGLRQIFARSEILASVSMSVADWLHHGSSKNRRDFWSLVWAKDKLALLDHIAALVACDEISDEEYEDEYASRITDLHLTSMQDAFLQLCRALRENNEGAMVKIINAADPQWFIVQHPTIGDGKYEYDLHTFVQDQLSPQISAVPVGRSSKLVRDAIGRYAARKFVSPLLRATHARLGDASPASLLVGFAHLTRYIADTIADNDRALEGVP